MFSFLEMTDRSEYNPADYFLDLISFDARDDQLLDASSKRIDQLALAFEGVEAKAVQLDSAATGASHDAPASATKYATSWLTQFWLLTRRSLKMMSREKANNFAMIGQNILFAVLLGIIWLQEGPDVAKGGSAIASIAGALFFIVVNGAFGSIFGILFLFPTERTIVLKERASRAYHVGAYFLSKTLAELPRTLVLQLLFGAASRRRRRRA